MATRTWSSLGSTDMNLSTNYSGSGALLTTDDLVFNSTSTTNATASSNLDVGSITIAATYSGAWSIAGYTLTVENNTGFSDSGITGAHNYGNGITLNGASAALTIAASGSAITATSCAITFNGATACVLTINRGTTFKSLVLGVSAIVTSNGSTYFNIQGPITLLTMGNNSTFTVSNGDFSLLTPTASQTIFSFGTGCTFNGTTPAWYIAANADGINTTIPATTWTGSSAWNLRSNVVTQNFVLSGNFNVNTSALNIYTNDASKNVTFSPGNYNVTCGALTEGSSNTGTFTHDYGSGTYTIASYIGSTYNTSAVLTFSTAQITCTGNWTFGSNHTVDAGASLITFTGTGASVVTMAGKSMYDVTVNNASKAFSFSGTPSLHNLTTTAMASYTHTGLVLTSSGNVTYNGSGTLNLGNGITMTGASGVLTIGSTVGTATTTSCDIIFNGTTACQLTNNKASVVFKSLTLGALAIVTGNGSAALVLQGTTTLLTLGNSASFTNQIDPLYLRPTANQSVFSFGTSTVFNGGGRVWIQPNNCTASVPATSYTGNGSWALFPTTGASGVGVTLTGDLSVGSNTMAVITADNITYTFNTGNFNLTCGQYQVGTNSVGAVLTANYANSSISVTSYTVFGALGTANLNFQKSQWTCSGNWTFGSNHNINHQWDRVTFTNTATITSTGKTFNYLILNAPTKTVTLADNLRCHGYQNIAGTLNTNSQSFNVTGDILETEDTRALT